MRAWRNIGRNNDIPLDRMGDFSLHLVMAFCLLFFLSVVAVPAHCQTDGNPPSAVERLLTGLWAKKGVAPKECACGKCIEFHFEREVRFCVESNQIFVDAFFKYDPQEKVIDLFYARPSDLGIGGAALPWDDFDPSYPLARISLVKLKQGEVTVAWNGFRNKKKPSAIYPFGDSYDGDYYHVTGKNKK